VKPTVGELPRGNTESNKWPKKKKKKTNKQKTSAYLKQLFGNHYAILRMRKMGFIVKA
jgi:hypothetical protein